MGLKSLHQGLVTAIKGAELIAFSFRAPTGTADRIRDGRGNIVASVSRTASGKYTITFVKPYPIQMVAGIVQASGADGLANIPHAFVVTDSYSKTAGTIQIQSNTDDGTPAVEDPANNTVFSFIGVFIRAGLNVMAQT